jgi:hypothetical protein
MIDDFFPHIFLFSIFLLAYLLFRIATNMKEWSSRVAEQVALDREANRHLERIAAALEARSK